MHHLLCTLVLAGLLLVPAAALAQEQQQQQGAPADDALPDASPSHLPRWRGFNLLEKFQRDWNNGPFREADFRLINELGFNFVRLPMDYRVWIVDGDWTRLNEEVLKEIDQAVAWGGEYGIHVMINFHRAPGYTVAQPPEPTSLWTDPETQRICAMHWAAFAKRYKGIPSNRLSFNLFNEPAGVEPEQYARVVEPIVAAIRAEDPDRLIVSDGLEWAKRPIPELAHLGIAQATRGYTPTDVSHYMASWMSGADKFPVPVWPRPVAQGTLYFPDKPDMAPEARRPLVIAGPFPHETQLQLHVMLVSSRARLVVRADDAVVFEKVFLAGPGEGEWKSSEHFPQWNGYQATYDQDYAATIPAGTRRVEVAVTEGDWLRLTEIGLTRPGEGEDVLTLRSDWNRGPARFRYAPAAEDGPFAGMEREDRQWLWDDGVAPWVALRDEHGVGVMIGEFGAYNRTPHDVVLRWMEDNLANWQRADMGWALWNFRGSFGILDSERQDVEYEDFHGHKLDRRMLELLQKY